MFLAAVGNNSSNRVNGCISDINVKGEKSVFFIQVNTTRRPFDYFLWKIISS